MTLYRVTLHDGTVAYSRAPPRPPPPLPHNERRKRWVSHWKREARRLRFWTRHSMMGPFYPKPLPEACKGLSCGARTRAGTPCQRRDIAKANGRCKLHGGASTGPRTDDGKARVTGNLGDFAKTTP